MPGHRANKTGSGDLSYDFEGIAELSLSTVCGQSLKAF